MVPKAGVRWVGVKCLPACHDLPTISKTKRGDSGVGLMTNGATESVGWYVNDSSGKNLGPYSNVEMRQAIGRGHVKATDLVWREGMDEWVEASRIPNFGEVRQAFKQEAERAQREFTPRRERIQPQPAKSRRPKSEPSHAAKGQARPASSAQQTEVTTPVSASSATTHDLQYWLRKLGKGEPGSEITADLEKKIGKATAKIGRIPPLSVAFFLFGLFAVPLLPVFWLIALVIWYRANKN